MQDITLHQTNVCPMSKLAFLSQHGKCELIKQIYFWRVGIQLSNRELLSSVSHLEKTVGVLYWQTNPTRQLASPLVRFSFEKRWERNVLTCKNGEWSWGRPRRSRADVFHETPLSRAVDEATAHVKHNGGIKPCRE